MFNDWPSDIEFIPSIVLLLVFLLIGQDKNIKQPTTLINKSKNCVKDVIWNKPLYIPIPDPIDWIYNILKLNIPESNKIIADILVKWVEEIFIKGIALATIKINIDVNNI